MAQASRRVLIDTSVLIAHLRGRVALEELLQDYDEIYVSAITLYELEYGAVKAERSSDFVQLSESFGPALLTVGRNEAHQAAQLNGSLAQKNKQIGPRDALIAGTALEHDLELLTLNVEEFRRVDALRVVSPDRST